jgi:hypothetical protein
MDPINSTAVALFIFFPLRLLLREEDFRWADLAQGPERERGGAHLQHYDGLAL